MFDKGAGETLIVIPGIQGRWEWMRPSLRALAREFRVISYSLCGDIGSGMKMDPALGFESLLRQLDAVLDRAGVQRAALCGVSFGGVIAAHYAATRPNRVSALILASAPGPRWKPTARQARYASRPWLSVPAFALTAIERLSGEIRAALPTWRSRIGFTVGYLASTITAPMMPHLMSARVRLHQALEDGDAIASISTPTLVVTGEPQLDLVVPVESTREYVRLIPGARYAMMENTGHLGMLTQPDRFARIVSDFIHARHT